MKVQIFRGGEDEPIATLNLSEFALPNKGDFLIVNRTARDKKKNPCTLDSFGSEVKHVTRIYKGQVLVAVSVQVV